MTQNGGRACVIGLRDFGPRYGVREGCRVCAISTGKRPTLTALNAMSAGVRGSGELLGIAGRDARTGPCRVGAATDRLAAGRTALRNDRRGLLNRDAEDAGEQAGAGPFPSVVTARHDAARVGGRGHAASALEGAAAAAASRSYDTSTPASSPTDAICAQYFAGMERPSRSQERTVTSATTMPLSRSAAPRACGPPSSLMMA